jgi:hypothetical protein
MESCSSANRVLLRSTDRGFRTALSSIAGPSTRTAARRAVVSMFGPLMPPSKAACVVRGADALKPANSRPCSGTPRTDSTRARALPCGKFLGQHRDSTTSRDVHDPHNPLGSTMRRWHRRWGLSIEPVELRPAAIGQLGPPCPTPAEDPNQLTGSQGRSGDPIPIALHRARRRPVCDPPQNRDLRIVQGRS